MPLPAVDYYRLPIDTGHFSWGTAFGVHDRWHPNGHRGTDLMAPVGTPIRAAAAGVVRRVAWSGCLGWYTVVEHRGGVFTGYNHQRERGHVKVGEKVARGQVIGYVGSTGSCTTGPHLHFTIGPSVDSNVFATVWDPRGFVAAHDAPDGTPAKTPLGRKYAVLASGQTLTQLATKNGISLKLLLKLNPSISNPDDVPAGLKVRVK